MEEKKENNFWTFFVNNKRFTIVFIITITIIGLLNIFQIKKESAPEVDFPIGVITTVFPGASALDVEELVTNQIESNVKSIDNIQELTSVSKNSLSVIIVQFDVGTDSDEKINELKDQVDKAKRELPADAEDPAVEKISFNNFPIIKYSLTGPYELSYLKSLAEDVQDELEGISGVSKVEISGGEEREIQVIVDKSLLDSYGISLSQVTQVINTANTDIPIGEIETGKENYNIKFNGRIKDVAEIEKIPVVIRNEAPIFIKDVAQVVDGVKEADSMSFLSLGEKASTPAISIDLYKTSEADTITVSKKANEKIAFLQKDYLPENIDIVVVEDQATYIENDLMNLFKNGLGTVLIVFLVLFWFIGFRESIVASLVVPLTFFITFIVLYNIGYTLNFVTLFSLILALGILVDSAIVVTEEMNNGIKAGKDPKQAALDTIKEYKMPLIAGTLTTVFVFVPMLMVSGIMGEFMRPIPVTVTIVLLTSLFVALSIITTLSIDLLRKKDKGKERENKIVKKIAIFYENFLKKFFGDKKLKVL